MQIAFRPIQKTDNPHLARIIRSALEEFGANHPGTVYYDASTDALFELFQHPGADYTVATIDDVVVGGGGLFPTEGLPEGMVELVKMYLAPVARGKGIGSLLIEKNISAARMFGYHTIYLESMPELKKALSVYAKFGFRYLDAPIGNSGHTGCSLWMSRDLDQAS